MRHLYSELTPFNHFFLHTGSCHQVYVEQCGNPKGIPVVFLHGGPCSGCKPDHRRFFDAEKYHIVLLDQRGCGRSIPFGETDDNTTQNLLDDLEAIRQRLGFEQWLLFGGSWGGTLTLLYAQQFPERVNGMILRGTFLARQKDLDWFLQQGVNRIYPEIWQELMACIQHHPDNSLLENLCATFFDTDEVTRRRLTRAWMKWGTITAVGRLFDVDNKYEHITDNMVNQAGMELNFARHRYFVEENQILENCEVLQDIPATIIHGRQDMVCPFESGYSLAQALPQAELIGLPNSGHIAQGEEMVDALVKATDKFAALLS